MGEVFLKSLSKIKNEKVCSQVLSLLMRIANGLRMPREDQTISVMHVDVTLSQLSKNVARRILHLIWIVDVIKEDGNWVQVVKVLDVLPEYKIPELKQNLKILFEKYTTELKNRCNHRCIER